MVPLPRRDVDLEPGGSLFCGRRRIATWRRRIPEQSQQCCPQASGRSAPPRWSAPSRSRPTSAPGSRSSTRCAPPCSRSVSASSPEHRRRSSPTRTTSRSSTPRAAPRTGTRRRSSTATTSRTGPRSTSSTRPTRRRCSRSTGRNVGAGRAPEVRAALIEEAIANAGPRAREAFATMCEVAQRFAGWLGFGSSIQAALEYVFARWDGRGFPDVARRRDPVADASPARRARHLPLPLRRRPRRGTRRPRASSGRRVRASARRARRCGTSTSCSPSWTRRGCGSRRWRSSRSRRSGSRARGSTPPSWRSPRSPVSSRRGFASTRRVWPISPRPPPGVLGLPAASVTLVRRAALAHDLGRVGVSNAIWEKPGRARLRRVGAGATPSPLHGARVRAVAGRSPRSGSWPAHTTSGSTAPATTAARAGRRSIRPARILAAADCYAAMREARPYRPALDCAGGRGGADARGRRRPARPGSGRRRARRRRPPRARSDRASCRPG